MTEEIFERREYEKKIEDTVTSIQKRIENHLAEIINDALGEYNCYAPNADSILLDSKFSVLDQPEYLEILSCIKSSASTFIQSALIAEVALIEDKSLNNIATADQIIALYVDLLDEYFTENPSSLYSQNKNYNMIRRAKKDLKLAISGIDSDLNEPNKVNDSFVYRCKVFHSTYREAFSSVFNSVPFFNSFTLEDEDKQGYPLSFFPFLACSSLNLTSQKSLFKKTENFITTFHSKKYRSKRLKTLITISKLYNDLLASSGLNILFGDKKPPCIAEANRFLFDALLHPEFFSSWNCSFVDTMVKKCRISELIADDNPDYLKNDMYEHLLQDESFFFIELLQMLMRFNVNLCNFSELTFFTEKVSLIIGLSDVKSIKSASPLRCIDVNIAFYSAMRFVYDFFDRLDASLGDCLTDLVQYLYSISNDNAFIVDVLNSLIPEHSYHYGNSVELTAPEEEQELLKVYLLNSCSSLSPHADILTEVLPQEEFTFLQYPDDKKLKVYIKRSSTES